MKTSFVLPLLLLGAVGQGEIALAQSPGTFTVTGGMTRPRFGHTATLLANGKVLIAGGWTAIGERTATAEIYVPDRIFTPTGDMTAPRYTHTATLLPDGRVLIAGGSITGGLGLIPSNVAEIYDPSTGTFAATGNMLSNNACHEATLLGNGKVLITGGYEANGGVPNAELYDPATGTFAATGRYIKKTFDLNECHGAVTSLLAHSRVLLVWQDGGAELYDPDTGSFTTTGNPIPEGGYYDGRPAATLLMSGKVLLAGGANDFGFPTIAGLYSLSTGTFTATGNMTIGRAGHTATLLPDGKVLLAGTYQFGSGSLASAEFYDPVAGAFTLTGAMTTPRSIHTATLLPNGRVLIAGGYTSGLPNSVADLYSPSVLVPAPQLFSLSGDGSGQGAIWRASTGEIATPSGPAVAGEALSMYTTSLVDGSLIPPQVVIGGRLAEILYFGAAPGYPGYNQVNFRVPSGVTPGPAVPVRLTYISRSTNAVTIGVQ